MWVSALLSYLGVFQSPYTSTDEKVGPTTSNLVAVVEHENDQTIAGIEDIGYVDEMCTKYCDDYFHKYCPSSNFFIYPFGNGRKLSGAEVKYLPRANMRTSEDAAFRECERTCMKFPRGIDPKLFEGLGDDPEVLAGIQNSVMGGDTIWCRMKHLSLITDYNSGTFHCPHGTNPSTGICRDSLINGFTPYELMRNGEKTRHHVGYCDVVGDGIVADCTMLGIDLETLPFALQSMPPTVEVIFMSGNKGLGHIPSKVFVNNLQNPEIIQALYFHDCGLTSIDEDILVGLPNLKIFAANNNQLREIPPELLATTPKLIQFEMFQNNIVEIPEYLFSNTPDLERLVVYGNPISYLYPNTLRGLSKVIEMSFVACEFTNAGIPDGVFQDMISLKYFDWFGNHLTAFEARWFDGGWARNVTRLAMWGNADLTTVEPEAFDTLDALEDAYFHLCGVKTLDMSLFEGKENFIHLTLG